MGNFKSRFLGSVPRCAKLGIRPAAVDFESYSSSFLIESWLETTAVENHNYDRKYITNDSEPRGQETSIPSFCSATGSVDALTRIILLFPYLSKERIGTLGLWGPSIPDIVTLRERYISLIGWFWDLSPFIETKLSSNTTVLYSCYFKNCSCDSGFLMFYSLSENS